MLSPMIVAPLAKNVRHAAGRQCTVSSDGRQLCRGKGKGLNFVSVRVPDEGGIVVGIVFRSQAGRPIARTAVSQRCLEECVDCGAILDFEGYVRTVANGGLLPIGGQVETERGDAGSITHGFIE